MMKFIEAFGEKICSILHFLFVGFAIDMKKNDKKKQTKGRIKSVYWFFVLLVSFFLLLNKQKYESVEFFMGSILFYITTKYILECIVIRELALHWKKVYNSYLKDDFAKINDSVKKINKIEPDPLIDLLAVEKFLEGKTTLLDKKEAADLLKKIDKEVKLPEKTKWEKHRFTKNKLKHRKSTKKKLKKEAYLKKIKGKAREMWNQNGFWALHHDLYAEIHTHHDKPIGVVKED